MKMIVATAQEWQKQCLQYAQAGEDFMVTGYLASDLQFLRNLGVFYNYAWGETTSAVFFRWMGKV